MSLNDAYHIVMMVVGVFGVILSTVLAVWTIYNGSRKHKKVVTSNVEAKKNNTFVKAKSKGKRTALPKAKNKSK